MTTEMTPRLDSGRDTTPISRTGDDSGLMLHPVTGGPIDERELAEQLLAQAKAQGVSLVGPGGLLSSLIQHRPSRLQALAGHHQSKIISRQKVVTSEHRR